MTKTNQNVEKLTVTNLLDNSNETSSPSYVISLHTINEIYFKYPLCRHRILFFFLAKENKNSPEDLRVSLDYHWVEICFLHWNVLFEVEPQYYLRRRHMRRHYYDSFPHQ